jgi:hypothetical protein
VPDDPFDALWSCLVPWLPRFECSSVLVLSRCACRLLPALFPFPLGVRVGCSFGIVAFWILFFLLRA